MVLMWSKLSCLGLDEIASLNVPDLIQGWVMQVSPRFHLFVCDVNQGN